MEWNNMFGKTLLNRQKKKKLDVKKALGPVETYQYIGTSWTNVFAKHSLLPILSKHCTTAPDRILQGETVESPWSPGGEIFSF